MLLNDTCKHSDLEHTPRIKTSSSHYAVQCIYQMAIKDIITCTARLVSRIHSSGLCMPPERWTGQGDMHLCRRTPISRWHAIFPCATYDLKGLVQGPFKICWLSHTSHSISLYLIYGLETWLLKFADHYVSSLLLLQMVQLHKFIKRPKEFERNTFSTHKDSN